MATVEKLLTAEEFARLPDDGRRYELVRGVLVEMSMPKARHGQVCSKVHLFVGNFCEQRQLGHVFCNDTGVLIERDPDTVRGADICYYPYSKVPPGVVDAVYLEVPPDVVFEVLSPDDRPMQVMRKTREYLAAGVLAVVILDPDDRAIEVYRHDGVEVVGTTDALKLPEIDPEFSVSTQRLLG